MLTKQTYQLIDVADFAARTHTQKSTEFIRESGYRVLWWFDEINWEKKLEKWKNKLWINRYCSIDSNWLRLISLRSLMIEWMNLPQYLLAAQNIELYKQISQTLQTSCLARLNGIIYSFHAIFSILIKLSKGLGGGERGTKTVACCSECSLPYTNSFNRILSAHS